MNDKLFIPQSVLDRWVDGGKVAFDSSVLTLLAEKKSYTLTPAVRFMKTVAGDDVAGLLGKVRTIPKIEELGAEHMSDSVILGDTAYEVQEGFIGVVLVDTEVATKQEAQAAPALQAIAESVTQTVVAQAVVAQPAVAAPIVAAPVAAPVPVPIAAPLPPTPAPEPVAPVAAAPPPSPAAVAATAASIAAAAGAKSDSDAEMLTNFLLNNLNF